MDILDKLNKSKFRNSFHLKEKDVLYIKDKGLNTIKKHAYDFVKNRLSNSYITNDGKQTPYKGHPVFIAQHATGTCCRSCLYKWHQIPKNIKLSNNQQEYIINIIMKWIEREMHNKN